MALTNGHGKQPLRVFLVQVGIEEKPCFEIKGEVRFDSPLDIQEVVFDWRQIVLPSLGHYAIKLEVNGEVIAERRIEVILDAPPTRNQNEKGT